MKLNIWGELYDCIKFPIFHPTRWSWTYEIHVYAFIIVENWLMIRSWHIFRLLYLLLLNLNSIYSIFVRLSLEPFDPNGGSKTISSANSVHDGIFCWLCLVSLCMTNAKRQWLSANSRCNAVYGELMCQTSWGLHTSDCI